METSGTHAQTAKNLNITKRAAAKLNHGKQRANPNSPYFGMTPSAQLEIHQSKAYASIANKPAPKAPEPKKLSRKALKKRRLDASKLASGRR